MPSIEWIVGGAAAAASAALAVELIVHEQRSGLRNHLVVLVLLLGLEAVVSSWAVAAPNPVVGYRMRLLLTGGVCGPLLWFAIAYGRGDAAERRRTWRAGLLGLSLAPLAAAVVFWTHLAGWVGGADGVERIHYGWPGVAVLLMFIAVTVLALSQLEFTLRASMGIMRWRVKYMVIGFAVLLAPRIYTGSQELIFAAPKPALYPLNGASLILGALLIGLALRRGRLHTVDLYLSHRVIYRSLTVLIAGIYLLVVGLLARWVHHFAGAVPIPLTALTVVVVLLGLVILLLSNTVRERVKRFVSRHFRRPQHDYRRVWTRFTRETASLMEVPAVCRAAATTVSETFEVLSVTIWVWDASRRGFVFGASTSLTEQAATEGMDALNEDPALAGRLNACAGPFPLDADAPAWSAALRAGNPDFFPAAPPVCVPLKSREELMGVMVIGDRVSRLPCSPEDIELLHTIGDQLGAKLMTIRQSGQLAAARELEAFQTMSAFFVHDLKNTSSTLALMLQNLPRHFEDPAFREDALDGMRRSVDRMNDLIQRLTRLRRSLDIQPSPQDLNDLVRGTVAELEGSFPAPPRVELETVPEVAADPGLMKTVLTNLLLNARDATRDGGEITVRTRGDGGRVVLSVTDHGCGMSREFLETELFKPFRSTKKEGMGIGLFHSRMIVEAHGGTLRAESRPGQGSTFRITLAATGDPDEATTIDH